MSRPTDASRGGAELAERRDLGRSASGGGEMKDGIMAVRTDEEQTALPQLSDEQLEQLHGHGEVRLIQVGEVLFREGDAATEFIVVLRGRVAVVDGYGTAGERVLGLREPREFLGELNLLTGERLLFTAVAKEPSEVLVVPASSLRALVGGHPRLGELVISAFLARRRWLAERQTGPQIIGSRFSSEVRRLREFLIRNRQPYGFLDLDGNSAAALALRQLGCTPADTPLVLLRSGEVLRTPDVTELALAMGVRQPVRPSSVADVLIIGAGPAGLGAAVYAASEGLTTVLADAVAMGGQAGTSSRIENYLGFPAGLSGADLAQRATLQARKFGATTLAPTEVCRLRDVDGHWTAELTGGEELVARSVILATGVRYRRLDVPHVGRFEGLGIYYAATHAEATACHSDQVVVVGGGNSAGQAALFLASHHDRVLLVVRRAGLSETMSRYLIDQIARTPNVELVTESVVRELRGSHSLRSVLIEHVPSQTMTEIVTDGLFVLTGGVPNTRWLRGTVALDDDGFVLTGPDLVHGEIGRGAGRPPLFLETSEPGVFAAGDVRHGSIKRVASAVGEGAMAVSLIHRHLS